MISTDGFAPKPGEGSPHPRSYGAFPRVLARYVREKKVLSLEEAIRRMTGLPSGRLKLPDRGLLRVGMAADIVVFNPDSIADRSEFARPHVYSEGVHHLVVNGIPVLLDGSMTGERPGRVLYGPARDVQ
jgi:N-acyl-D-aspartate/D-glutamate deacylase